MDFSTIDPSVFAIAGPVTLILIVLAALIVRSQKKAAVKTPKKQTKPVEVQPPKKTAPKKKADKVKEKSKQAKKRNLEQSENQKKVEQDEDSELETKSQEKVESEVKVQEEQDEVESNIESSDDELFPEIQSKRNQVKIQPKSVASKKKSEKKPEKKVKLVVHQEEPTQTVQETPFDSSEWEEVNKRGIKRKQKLESGEQMVVINTTSSSENTVITIEITPELMGVVIGKGGLTIRQVESSTGTKISVVKGLVSISGSSDEAEAARVAISNIITDYTENARLIETDTVDIGTSGSAVIGKGGSTLKKIENHSGAKLSLPKESSILSITGTKEQIEKAKALVNNAIYGEASIPIDLGEKGSSVLLKKNGEIIKSVMNLYPNARLDLKKEEKVCLVYGSAEHVAEAAQMVTKIINEYSYRKTILVGNSLGMVLGKGGENIKQIQTSTDVFVDISKDDEGQNRIHLTGQKDRVIRAHDLIENILALPFNPTCAPGETFIHIEVGEAIGQVIGTKRSKITEIETSSGAKLNVPNGTSLCVVQGTNEQIQAAKTIIEEIVKRFEEANTPVNVDSFQSSITTLKSKKKIVDYENDWGGTCAAFGW